MLISISEAFETPVSTLLGETVAEAKTDDLRAISEKLEVINLQLAHRKTTRQKVIALLLPLYHTSISLLEKKRYNYSRLYDGIAEYV